MSCGSPESMRRSPATAGCCATIRNGDFPMIKGLHHNAYRCRDSEETRVFYEDFLGLKLVSAFEIGGGVGPHQLSFLEEAPFLRLFDDSRNALALDRRGGFRPLTPARVDDADRCT